MELSELDENGPKKEDDTLMNERVSEEQSRTTAFFTSTQFKVSITLLSIILNLFDLITDFLTGLDLIDNLGGRIIISVVFLPAVAAIILGVYQYKTRAFIKPRQHTAHTFAYTLLDINWLDLDDREKNGDDEGNTNTKEKIKKSLKKIKTVLFFVCRINSFKDYVIYLKKLRKKEKEDVLKDFEQRIRADEFLDAVFENLPQVCVQLHIFGLHSTVTHLQIISLFFSVTLLLFKISKISIARELLIREETKKKYLLSKKRRKMKLQRMFSLQPISENDPQTSGLEVNQNAIPSLAKITKADDLETLELNILHKNAPSKKILIDFEYSFDKENKDYFLTEKTIRCKEEGIGIETKMFYNVRIFQISVEGFTFFIPTLPAVALFSSLFGRCFAFLYVPAAGHFIAEFWWWRMHTYKKRFTMAFHTVFWIFKVMERVFIIVLISVWFIKVIDYSKPDTRQTSLSYLTERPVPSLVYPEPNPFLNAIASYEKDGYRKDWAKDCHEINNNTMTIDFNRAIYSGIPFCAIIPSRYIFCIVFYINAIGFFFDFAVFLAYVVFNWKFQEKLGKFEEEDRRGSEGCHQSSICDEPLVFRGVESA